MMVSTLLTEQTIVLNSSIYQFETFEIYATTLLTLCKYFLICKVCSLSIYLKTEQLQSNQNQQQWRMGERKNSDLFSFRDHQHQFSGPFDRKQLMANYQYRIDAINKNIKNQQRVDKKTMDLDRIIEEKAKKKQQLQQSVKKEDLVQPLFLKKLIEKKNEWEQGKMFSKVEFQKQSKKTVNNQRLSKIKPYAPKKLQLDHAYLAHIEKILTFPEYPSISKEKQIEIKNKLKTLVLVHEHSDLIYLLMKCYYHLQEYQNVLVMANQLVVYKRFNTKGFWISAEAAYNLEQFMRCKQLSQLSISQIKDNINILPRLLYLKAKSNMQLFNDLQAIVAYNQLIVLEPSVAEYYLERSLLFQRSNYNNYAKNDFQKYCSLKVNCKKNLREKILVERRSDRKEYYQALLRSLQQY